MGIHVFIDNSNMLGGAQRCGREIEPHVPWVALRVYFRNLFALLERNRERMTGIVGGSVPPGSEPLWGYARELGYDTHLLQKIENDTGRLGEQGVDEVICAHMANVVLDWEPPQVMVAATGDGRMSGFGLGFIAQLERALRRDWSVKVYSWSAQTSSLLRGLSNRYGDRVVIVDLDPFYHSLTFVKEGHYRYQTAESNVVEVDLAGRVVGPLPDLSP